MRGRGQENEKAIQAQVCLQYNIYRLHKKLLLNNTITEKNYKAKKYNKSNILQPNRL